MASNKIAVLEKSLPLRAYIKEDLNKAIIMEFLPWICSLLSLTDQKSADRLEYALPTLKKLCIGMGFKEIRIMFEMYADGKLDVQPRSNYFDRILLGKIVSQYQSQKPKEIKEVKPMYISEDEKRHIMLKGIKEGKEIYLETGKMELVGSRYKWLDESGIFLKKFNITQEQFDSIKSRRYDTVADEYKQELEALKPISYKDRQDKKEALISLKTGRSQEVIIRSKTSILIDYFKS